MRVVPRKSLVEARPVELWHLEIAQDEVVRFGELEWYAFFLSTGPRRDGEPTRAWPSTHGVMGVGDEIHDHLVKLVWVGPENWEVGRQLEPHLDVIHFQGVGEQLDRLLDDLVQPRLLALGRALTGERQEVPYGAHAAFGR